MPASRVAGLWISVLMTVATLVAQRGLDGLQQRLAETGERGVVALRQAVGDAASDTLVLLVASHPDDRWVLPAAYLRFQHYHRVAVLLFTRGEGGQNATGPETGDELGAIRTLETEISAARLDARVYHLNRLDTGFCKTAEEALQSWGVRSTVGDLARFLRRLRPDLVVTTHHPDESHGHDLALLRILPEAIDLAANEAFVTPGFEPLRTPRAFRGAAADEEPTEVLDLDAVDRLRGDTYRRLAYAALAEHRSQAPLQPIDQLLEPTLRLVPLPLRSADPEQVPHLLTGLPSLRGVAGNQGRLHALLLELELGLLPLFGRTGEMVGKALALREQLLEVAAGLRGDSALRAARRLDALERVILQGSGLRVAVEAEHGRVAVPGERLPLKITFQNGPFVDIDEIRLEARGGGVLELPPDASSSPLPSRQSRRISAGLRVAEGVPDRAAVLAQLFRQESWQPPISLTVVHRIGGQEIERIKALPFEVRAAVELQATPKMVLLPRGRDEVRLAIAVRRHGRQPLRGVLQVLAPPGFVVQGAPTQIFMERETARIHEVTLRIPAGLKPGISSIQIQLGDARVEVPLHKIDVELETTQVVGLVKGVDDAAEAVLRGLGVRLVVLGDEDLAVRPLDDLATIVCDIRSLQRQSAREAFPRFLRFAEAGGRILVLYHKDVEFNLDSAGFQGAPFELRVGKTRVTRADAPITLLDPSHPLVTWPNPIQAQDFDGWVQERGLYFPERPPEGDAYLELLTTADPGEPPARGALLYTRHGRGDYVYCALALHRQLKNLHPGACRLFANLVANRR